MKLAVMADLHVDLVPDGQRRLQAFYEAACREKADMIVNLGDFAAPKEENRWVAEAWRNCPLPHIMVLGNHDMDNNDKSAYMQFYGIQCGYRTFISGGVQFILLDTNHFEFGGVCYDYAYANYYDKAREYLGPAQREWLRGVLAAAVHPCVLLSHEGLEHTGDREAILAILQEYREKIAVCINGHNHVDGLTAEAGIHFLDVISMSQHWIGETEHLLTAEDYRGYFTEEEFCQNDWLQYVVPFTDAMYELVDIDAAQKQVTVTGTKSRFIGKSPIERGHCGTIHGIAQTAEVKEKSFSWGAVK